jgi:hypothetical protein
MKIKNDSSDQVSKKGKEKLPKKVNGSMPVYNAA